MPKNFEPRPAFAHRKEEQELEEEALDLAAMEAEQAARTKPTARKTQETARQKAEEPTPELRFKIEGNVTQEQIDHAFDGMKPKSFTVKERILASQSVKDLKRAYEEAANFLFPTNEKIEKTIQEWERLYRTNPDINKLNSLLAPIEGPLNELLNKYSIRLKKITEGKGVYRTREKIVPELTPLGELYNKTMEQQRIVKNLLARPWFVALVGAMALTEVTALNFEIIKAFDKLSDDLETMHQVLEKAKESRDLGSE